MYVRIRKARVQFGIIIIGRVASHYRLDHGSDRVVAPYSPAKLHIVHFLPYTHMLVRSREHLSMATRGKKTGSIIGFSSDA